MTKDLNLRWTILMVLALAAALIIAMMVMPPPKSAVVGQVLTERVSQGSGCHHPVICPAEYERWAAKQYRHDRSGHIKLRVSDLPKGFKENLHQAWNRKHKHARPGSWEHWLGEFVRKVDQGNQILSAGEDGHGGCATMLDTSGSCATKDRALDKAKGEAVRMTIVCGGGGALAAGGSAPNPWRMIMFGLGTSGLCMFDKLSSP